jgi:hypothetical protein
MIFAHPRPLLRASTIAHQGAPGRRDAVSFVRTLGLQEVVFGGLGLYELQLWAGPVVASPFTTTGVTTT